MFPRACVTTLVIALAISHAVLASSPTVYYTSVCEYVDPTKQVSQEGYDVDFVCPGSDGPITSVVYARYGENYPSTAPACGESRVAASSDASLCPAPSAAADALSSDESKVAAACVGKYSCTIHADNNFFGDHCNGIVKSFIAKVACKCQDGYQDADGNPTNGCETKVSQVNKDPHFAGLAGEKYEVQGTPEKWFNIVSDREFMVNAFFHQQTYNLKNYTNMLDVAVVIEDQLIYANKTSLYLNGERLRTGSNVSISLKSGKPASIEQLDNNDWAINAPYYLMRLYHTGSHMAEQYYDIDLSLTEKHRNPHGLLGQTAHHRHGGETVWGKGHQGEGEIEGVYTDYIVSGPYATDFIYNKFTFNTAEQRTSIKVDSHENTL